MGFFDDLAMGTGLKDRDDDYYERTAQTLGRKSQGGSAQREAQYRGSMGMNNGATVGGGQLDKRGGLLPFMEGGGTIGAIARGIGGKGGGKTEQASNSQNLGLGGLQSFFGTRGPAAQSELGNAQMQATLTDNLPGYFDPATREYVPWYVDLFNGGGFNSAGGEDGQAQSALPSAQASASPRQISPQARLVQSDMPNTNMTGIPGYTLPQSDMPNTNMTGIPGYTLPQSDILNAGMTESIPENLAMFSLTTPGTGWDNAIGQTRERPSSQMSSANFTQSSGYMPQLGMPQWNLPRSTMPPKQARQRYQPSPPASGMLSPPAQAAPATSSEDSFLDRLLSGEIAALNRATLNGDVETEAFVKPTLPDNNVQPEQRDSVLNDLRGNVYTTGPVEGFLNWLDGDVETEAFVKPTLPDNNVQPMSQDNLNTNPEYQEFIRLLENAGGFDRELQDPEWLMRTFKVGKAKGRL